MDKLNSNNKENHNNANKKPQSLTFNPSPSKCLCSRPKTNILCNNCGNMMFGRISYSCNIHERVSFLCDIFKCTRCSANSSFLSEILDPSYIY